MRKYKLDYNDDGQTYLKTKVITKASRNEIVWFMDDGTLKVRINKPPEKWKANKEIIHFLKKEFSVNDIEIISWKADTVKLLRIKK